MKGMNIVLFLNNKGCENPSLMEILNVLELILFKFTMIRSDSSWILTLDSGIVFK